MTTKINFKGIDFDVEYDYQPYEPMVMYDSNMEGYPGCAEMATLEEITHKETNFLEFFESQGLEREIEELILESMHE